MSPAVRKAALTAHVTSSVGWLGAVLVFLTLAISALASTDERMTQSLYAVMNLAVWRALVPLAVTALVTGLIQALGTPWGLFRHYWVVFKLALTSLGTIVLLLYTQTLAVLAELADRAAGPAGSLTVPEQQLLGSPTVVVHTSAALLLLLATTVLAIYKPRGRLRLPQR